MQLEPIKPADIMLGNFIDNMGEIEIVTGIVMMEEGFWQITHTAHNSKKNPVDNNILYSAYPIHLTQRWSECLKINEYKFPDWLLYVHQAQNYMKWYANVELREIMDWNLFKKIKIEYSF